MCSLAATKLDSRKHNNGLLQEEISLIGAHPSKASTLLGSGLFALIAAGAPYTDLEWKTDTTLPVQTIGSLKCLLAGI